MMTKLQWEQIKTHIEGLPDSELIDEYVKYDKEILRLWADIDTDTSDIHEYMRSIICDRFVMEKSSYVWDDEEQNWVGTGSMGSTAEGGTPLPLLD